MKPGLDQRYRPEDETEQNDVEAQTLQQDETDSAGLLDPVEEEPDEYQAGCGQYGQVAERHHPYSFVYRNESFHLTVFRAAFLRIRVRAARP